MREDIAGPQGASSRPMWETLEGMVREKAQEFIQQIMEEEVTELLGREKSERRSTVDSAEGYRNGYGKPRRLAMSSGTITLRRPRVRGVEDSPWERWRSVRVCEQGRLGADATRRPYRPLSHERAVFFWFFVDAVADGLQKDGHRLLSRA